MMPKEGQVLILPHPGDERRIPSKADPNYEGVPCDWPPKKSGHKKLRHSRKFMQLTGKCCDSGGHVEKEGLLDLWTEYEAPTKAIKLSGPYQRESGEPEYVHTIIMDLRDCGTPTMNTDPWIFHKGFVWSTCLHKNANKASEGGIVLFGSKIQNEWVLDTVFVIEKRLDELRSIPERRFGAAYDDLVRGKVNPKAQPFIGKPFQNIDTPFSFVPCKRERNGHASFARPSMNKLFRKLRMRSGSTPNPRNGRWLAYTEPVRDISTFWAELLQLIAKSGLAFGIEFKHPGVRMQQSLHFDKKACASSVSEC